MRPTRDQLVRYDAEVGSDRPWQRGLRLLQSMWREDQGHQPGLHRGRDGAERRLGSRLPMPDAEQALTNYLTDTIREVVRDELAAETTRAQGKLFSTPRIYEDLLSSQPLCFNLFGELKADLSAASRWAAHLWPERIAEVTRIEFEHSPGRGDERYLGNRTAFDVYLEHTTRGGERGFIGIEVKYHESLEVGAAEVRERPTEVAAASDAFVDPMSDALRTPPLQQVWFDHLLALSMLQADADRWGGNGLFVFLHPVANVASYRVVNAYEQQLASARTFQRMTLEEAVAALSLTVDGAWPAAFHDRYLDYGKLARA